jgi:signal recognition particle GTPase
MKKKVKNTQESLKQYNCQSGFNQESKASQESDDWEKKLEDEFSYSWYKFIDLLTGSELKRMLKERNLNLQYTCQHVKGKKNGTGYWFDIIAQCEDLTIIVEVEYDLDEEIIQEFIERLERAKVFMEEYRKYVIHGAVASLNSNPDCEKMAEMKGLFVIRATGSSATLINPPDFKPKIF